MKLFKNFTIKMIKMNFILWKITIKHNFDWKYYALFFFFLLGVCIYINYRIKKCVCIIKKCVCSLVCIYVHGGYLDKNIIVPQLDPPKQKSLSLSLSLSCVGVFVCNKGKGDDKSKLVLWIEKREKKRSEIVKLIK